MKKNYFKLMTLTLGIVATSISAFSQKELTNEKAICSNVLTASTTGVNQYDGVMFDMAAINDVTIETFSIILDNDATIEIYVRTGSFVGFNASATGWTLVGSGAVVAAGPGVPVEIPVDINYTMLAGSTHGFYISATTSGSGFKYSTGQMGTLGNSWATDGNIDLKAGNGGQYPFNLPSVWVNNFNGNVIYCIPLSTDVEKTLTEEYVNVYPNPANDVLNISLPESGKATSIAIYNMIGEIVFLKNVIADETTVNFDVSNLKSGVYMVKLASDDANYTTKLFIY